MAMPKPKLNGQEIGLARYQDYLLVIASLIRTATATTRKGAGFPGTMGGVIVFAGEFLPKRTHGLGGRKKSSTKTLLG